MWLILLWESYNIENNKYLLSDSTWPFHLTEDDNVNKDLYIRFCNIPNGQMDH